MREWTSQSGWLGRTLCVLLLVALPLGQAAAMIEPQEAAARSHAAEPFPAPAALEPAITFWVKVFSEWRRDQLALHDSEHLGVIYRVVTFPGAVAEGLTRDQQTWLRRQREDLANDLHRLAARHNAGLTLTSDEQQLLARIQQGGGRLAGAADRVRAQRGTRERFLRGLEISGRYDQRFREIFRAAGLPEDLAYLPHVESSFQYHAKSHVGAAGIWQFMPATGRQFMRVNATIDERLDPIIAAHGAARYLAQAHKELGSWPLALTSYNHGIGSMKRAKAQYGHDFARIVREYDAPSFGFASRNFYPEFLAVRRIAQAPVQHFPEGVNFEPPRSLQALVLKHPQPVQSLSRQTGHSVQALAGLNPAWTDRALQGRASLPAGTTVWLPSGGQPLDIDALARSEFASLRSGVTEHRVVKGESLWSIARRYNTSVQRLSVLNGLDAAKPVIKPGQVLSLPGRIAAAPVENSASDLTHKVTPGDTPFGIAASYKVSLKSLLAANNMTAKTKIHPGQQLVIPRGE